MNPTTFRNCVAPLVACLLATTASATEPNAPILTGGDDDARIAWTRIFASAGDDWINDVVPIGEGTHLVVGFLDRHDDAAAPDWRAFAAALAEGGTIRWSREHGAGAGIDAYWSAHPIADGGLALAGFTTRIGAGGIDALALFAGADGNVVGEQAFGGAGYDRFTSLAPADDGFLFLGHSQPAGETRRRVFLVRTDSAGRELWQRIIEGPESLAALYVEPAGGGFVVAGGIARDGQSDLLVLKLDVEGHELWRRTIGTAGADDVNHGLVVLPNGNIVVVGYSQSWGARGNDILAATLDSSGNVLHREMLGGAEDDRPILARHDGTGGVWIVGSTRSAGAGGSDGIVARLDPQGRFLPGALTFGTAGDETGTAIRPLASGALIVAGYSNALGGGAQDAFVLRLDNVLLADRHPAFERRAVPPD